MPHQCTNCGHTFPDGSKEMLSGCPDCGGNKFQFTPARPPERTSDNTQQAGSKADTAGSSAQRGAPGHERGGAHGRVSRATETVRDWVTTGREREESGSNSSETAERERSDSFPEWPDSARPPSERSGESSTDEPAGGARRNSPTQSPPASESARRDRSVRTGSRSTENPEDTAQADARSAVVSPDELPPHSGTAGEEADGADKADPPDHGRVVKEPSGERPSLEQLREELNDQFESIKVVKPGQYELNLMELYDREEYIVSLQEDGRYVIDVPDSWREGADDS
ncbi:Zn-ribbon domain-containing protein [Natronobiforma cellulositropha]|uniref:Zn-ribbon domain-containing protein n=1 Tax=Natronobiforma cellulositropha TaxID=1679076 RepID=UPI0021D584EC|nr:Zn-ribbon containing protein [Natronobiforma cellulositropha]